MVEKRELDNLIWKLLRGFREGFEVCEIIQEGVSYTRAIPKSFWRDEAKGYYGILGLYNLTKSEMRQLHNEVVERIIQEINEPNECKMCADNYARLFHALAILKVPKFDTRVHAIGTNYMYNIAYDLWALDDGSTRKFEFISNAAWYAAEAIKEGRWENGEIKTGRRHSFAFL